MPIPKKIKIAYFPNSYTGDMGVYEGDRQFFAQTAAIHQVPPGEFESWQKYKRWYAFLHTFDKHGNHLNTIHWFAGTTADGEDDVFDKARRKRSEMIAALGDCERGDISIKLFQTYIDGEVVGMVDTSDEDSETVTMMPSDLVFFAPWDGRYDT